MASHRVNTNPNEIYGGTGCLYSGAQKDFDCSGPYTVFPAVKVLNGNSPVAAICEFHLQLVARSGAEVLPLGYMGAPEFQAISRTVDSTAVEIVEKPAPKRRRKELSL